MDGPVALGNRALVEPRDLELPVHVGGEDEAAVLSPAAPAAEEFEPVVGAGGAVQVETVAVEPPGQLRVAFEPTRARHLDEGDSQLTQRWVRAPETLISAEVWKSRVDAHASAGRDQHRVCSCDRLHSTLERGLIEEGHGGSVYFDRVMKLVQDEVPRHFEALRLSPRLRIAGWPAAIVAAFLGVTMASLGNGGAAGVIGVALAALGAVGIAGLVRCGVFEIVVGSRLLTVGTGPFRRRIPLGLITSSDARRSRSWRRLYADAELELSLADGRGRIILPSREPRELAEALQR